MLEYRIMQVIADLQVHSKYAQAVSKYMELEAMSDWAQKKGIDLITTGDWTHPNWYTNIKNSLVEMSEGVYQLKTKNKNQKAKIIETKFLLVTEVSCRYYQNSKYHGVHILVFAPNLKVVEKINKEFRKRGWEKNLKDDGRPMLPISCEVLAEIILGIDLNCLLIPAHSWTPWFGFYGAHGGFDSIEEAFGKYSKYIYAVETGLGSDPAMNWRIKELDNRNIVSFSDAHSLPKIGREATVFEISDERKEIRYKDIYEAIVNKSTDYGLPTTASRIAYTIEFYRQEGKYHATGHRKCNVSYLPEETPKDFKCPVCGKKLTVGAAQRTEDLASRNEKCKMINDKFGTRWVYSKDQPRRPPFVNIVPLQEVLSEVFGVGVTSKKVQGEFEKLTSQVAPEFELLLKAPLKDIEKFGGERLREAIERNRRGEVVVKPGFDGVFGEVKIFPDNKVESKTQLELI